MMPRKQFELNDKELKVWESFPAPDGKEAVFVTIEDLARVAFKSHGITPGTKGNSWVRNSLRKLRNLELVSMNGGKSGLYARTKLTPEEVLTKAIKAGFVSKDVEESPPAKKSKGEGGKAKKENKKEVKAKGKESKPKSLSKDKKVKNGASTKKVRAKAEGKKPKKVKATAPKKDEPSSSLEEEPPMPTNDGDDDLKDSELL